MEPVAQVQTDTKEEVAPQSTRGMFRSAFSSWVAQVTQEGDVKAVVAAARLADWLDRPVEAEVLPDALDWVSLASNDLARLDDGRQYIKRRETVIALVVERMSGRAEENVWDRSKYPGVCNRRIYHQKWKFEATFAEVLDKVTKLALEWRSKAVLADAAFTLAANSKRAADRVVGSIDSWDEGIALKASLAVLDRNQQTSPKGGGRVDSVLHNIDYSKLSEAQLERIASGEDVLAVILDGYTSGTGTGTGGTGTEATI